METPNQNPTEEKDLIQSAKDNKKKIITVAVLVVAVAVAAIVWFLVNQNGAKDADEAIALADIEQNDTTALALYKDAAKLGHASGNRAKLNAAIALYNDGKYQEALDYLKDASVNSDIVEAGQYSLMGDCYVNLKQNAEALKAFDKAISAADGNPQIVPFILVKKANIYRAEANYKDEAKAYETIIKDYPEYAQSRRFDIRAYAERAKAQAGE
ncbi:MAG: hypothetical protein NC241_01540 [Bacteroides sp.]|nr:hypothetical protein [Bacteroides sp.]MCM1458390.1 hypothetical protein [Lachnoclostridium sp.]